MRFNIWYRNLEDYAHTGLAEECKTLKEAAWKIKSWQDNNKDRFIFWLETEV